MLHGASVGLKIAIPLPDTTLLVIREWQEHLQIWNSAFISAALRSSISGVEEKIGAANRLHAISTFP
ncbi:hypothetical protein T12_11992 [Trichinella patagoniensis]|uniref:Uncharacterized protein n=1 Tax=Trichinella patagoniensis TaxID=990121 RepID=A0A0V0ZJ96_9BILA|nr:hypothetical protein T12_11992 [Trichinella patagoniensis]